MEAFGGQFSQTSVVPRLGAVNQGLEAFMCDSLRSTRDGRPGVVSPRCRFDIAILIVGFRNSEDILTCLAALSRMECEAAFDVFICENGGREAYRELVERLNCPSCLLAECDPADGRVDRAASFMEVRRLQFKNRASNVWVGCAEENLGYAGGINAWLKPLTLIAGWKGIWILNPDAEPRPNALAALIERAEKGRKAMVGSTILESGSEDLIRFRGGLHWQTLAARGTAVGLHDRIGDPFDLFAIEEGLDAPSGASTYATRQCVEQIGFMEDSYFLFFEDLEWGARAKKLGLGYASDSIVAHRGGTTTGSSGTLRGLSKLSVYLEHRNAIHFVRKHRPWTLPIRIVLSLLYALRFLMHGAPRNSVATLEGLFAGLCGETGRPAWHR
ncbi:glycosyltransferase family 2 protein [Bradyrhizobium lupini]|uniref:glycosyltransferase family 2 protein n=1 Tax=Rhizobium lupini TaxID=136996 RepID=UPI0034C65243